MLDNLIELLLAADDSGKQIIESLPIAIYATDHEGRLTYYNTAAVKLSGRMPDLNDDRWCVSWKLFYPDGSEMPHNECPMAVALKTGQKMEGIEAIAERPDGNRFWFKAYPVPVYNDEGKVIAGINMLVDITDQKEIEKQLRRSMQTQGELREITAESDRQKRLFEAFISSTPDLVYVFDLDYRFTFANEALLEMWGRTSEDSIGKNLLEIGYEPWHAEMHERELDKVVTTGEHVKGVVSFSHVKLGPRIYEYIFVPVYDENGKVEAVAGTTRDVTGHKQTEEALRKSEEKYRTLFLTMDDGFDIIEMIFNDEKKPVDFYYLETNPASDKQSGIRNRVGKKISEILPELEEDWLWYFGNVALTGEPVQFERYTAELERWFDVSAFRLGEPEERKVAVIYKNITERKRVQEQLRIMNESLEERVKERTRSLLSYQAQLRLLASQLNKAEEKQRHQLATELHDNLGQLLALGKMKIEQLQIDQFSDQTSKNIDELKEVIEDALTYSRDLMSDLRPPPSIDDDIRASISWIAEKLEKHGLKVIIKDDNRPKLVSEEIRSTIQQSIRELLFNVIKHTTEKKVFISLSVIDDRLQIIVKDEGEGFDSENIKLIRENEGRFGLFNIQERIDLIGGIIDIESKIGKGTKITLYFPLTEENKTGGNRGEDLKVGQVTKTKNEHRIKVLIVDDHQMFRKGVRKIIEDEYDIMVIDEAADGEEAILKARETSPDVIIMDVNMPRMDGIEATRRIIADMPDMRIIALSLYNELGIVEEMRKAGASAYLTKTEAFESLIGSIRAEASFSEE